MDQSWPNARRWGQKVFLKVALLLQMIVLIFFNKEKRENQFWKYHPAFFRLSKKPRKLERLESGERGTASRILMREIVFYKWLWSRLRYREFETSGFFGILILPQRLFRAGIPPQVYINFVLNTWLDFRSWVRKKRTSKSFWAENPELWHLWFVILCHTMWWRLKLAAI